MRRYGASPLHLLAHLALRGAINYVRVPAGIWLLLGLVYYPTLAGRGDAAYHRVSGLHFEGYLGRWLLSGAVLFSISAIGSSSARVRYARPITGSLISTCRTSEATKTTAP